MLARVVDTARWQALGEHRRLLGRDVFVTQRGEPDDTETILVLHGFPTCSYEWRAVADALGASHHVVMLDMLGYGLSEKPLDHTYSLFEQADLVEAAAAELGLRSVVLVTHDMGDSVGGELCARALDGTLRFDISARVVTNGSIYMDLVQLSAGQQVLLALPDEALPDDQAITAELFKPGLAATFGPDTQPTHEELEAQWELTRHNGGNRILPKLIRYVEERRAHEDRWTGAVEKHPSPLTIVWGDVDPIAVYPMAERLKATRPDATLVRLPGIGHYPMVEAADEVTRAIESAIRRTA